MQERRRSATNLLIMTMPTIAYQIHHNVCLKFLQKFKYDTKHESHEPNWSKLHFLPSVCLPLPYNREGWRHDNANKTDEKRTWSNYYLAPIDSQSTAVSHTFRVITIAVENWCSNTLHKSKCQNKDDYTNTTSRVCGHNILTYYLGCTANGVLIR